MPLLCAIQQYMHHRLFFRGVVSYYFTIFLLSSFLEQQPGYQKISNETKTVQIFKESVHLEIFIFFFFRKRISLLFFTFVNFF